MSQSCKISVVIPCFNHGEFLPEAVSSVTRLNRTDVELIVVDDGSTEERTQKEINLLSDRGVKVLRQANKGLAAARNAGIKLAQGEFILPLDSDNRIREGYLVSGIKILEQQPKVGVVYGNAEYFGEQSGPWLVQKFNWFDLAHGNFIDACALYRRSVWESVQGYDEKMPWMGWEDWDFWLRAAGCGWEFAHLDEIAFDYRVRAGSMIKETNRHQDELLAYIFGKPTNQVFRERSLEMSRLRLIEASREYRLGRSLLAPWRRLQARSNPSGKK